MAVTRITSTRNGAGAIDYVLRPKEKDRERVRAININALFIDGLESGNNTFNKQMRHVRESNGKQGLNQRTNEKYVQAYRLIQSFDKDELDPNNEDDVRKCNAIGLELAKELYPDNQSLVVTHSDGIGGNLHNHIVVNAVRFTNGKSLRGKETNWDYISKVSDEVVERNGLEVIEKGTAKDLKTQAEIELAERGEYVWKDDLKSRINASIEVNDVTDNDSFKDYMREEYDVDVRFRGKGMSFAFIDEDNKKRRIRAGRLGSNYQREHVEELIQSKEREVIPEVVPRRRRRTSMSSLMNDLKNEMDKPKEEKQEVNNQAKNDAQGDKQVISERVLEDNKKREQERINTNNEQLQEEKAKAQENEEIKARQLKMIREEMQREKENRIAKEKEELLSNMKHIYMDVEYTARGNIKHGYRDDRDNRYLTEDESKWVNEYKEEQEAMKNNDYPDVEIDDGLDF